MNIFTTDVASLSVTAIVAALNEHHTPIAAALRAEGATAERERIQAVRAQLMPGHEKLIEQLAFDGKTTGPEAAVAVVNAEREAAAKRRAALDKDTPPAVPSNSSATGDVPPKGKETAADPMADAQQLAVAIAKVQAEAAAAGRPINAIQAMALVKQQAKA